MTFRLTNFRNGVRIKSEDFPSREEAERAQRDCQNIIDAAILEIEGQHDSGAMGAIKELEQETFEVGAI